MRSFGKAMIARIRANKQIANHWPNTPLPIRLKTPSAYLRILWNLPSPFQLRSSRFCLRNGISPADHRFAVFTQKLFVNRWMGTIFDVRQDGYGKPAPIQPKQMERKRSAAGKHYPFAGGSSPGRNGFKRTPKQIKPLGRCPPMDIHFGSVSRRRHFALRRVPGSFQAVGG